MAEYDKGGADQARTVHCCGCCSVRCMTILVVVIALFPTIINPLLDALVATDNEAAKPPLPEQQEGTTLIEDYPRMRFLNANETMQELNIGLVFILHQSFPRWFVWLVSIITEGSSSGIADQFKSVTTAHNVTFNNAREADLRYEATGFTLLSLPKPSATQDWRSKDDIKRFQGTQRRISPTSASK